MILTRPRWSSVLLVLAMILSAGVAGALFAQIPASDAAPSSGERSVTETITPCRILETRGAAFGGPTGVPLAGPVAQGQTLTLPVAGASGQGCSVGAGLTGAVLNITAVNATVDTFLTVYPCDKPKPNASTLNPFPGRITFNSAVTDLSATGTVCIFNNAGAVDILVDVTGILYDHNHDDRYYTEDESNESFVGAPEGVRLFAAGYINSGGPTLESSVGPVASVASEGVGEYEITLSEDYRVSPSTNVYILVSAVNINGNTCTWAFDGASANSFDVDCYTPAGASQNTSFDFVLFLPGAEGLTAIEPGPIDPASGM